MQLYNTQQTLFHRSPVGLRRLLNKTPENLTQVECVMVAICLWKYGTKTGQFLFFHLKESSLFCEVKKREKNIA